MVQEFVVGRVDEKLRSGRVGRLRACHGQAVLCVFQAVVAFVLNGGIGVLLFHVRLKTTPLNHEARNDTVKNGVVIVSLVDVVQEVFNAQGRFFSVELNEDDAFAGDVEFDLRIAHGYCTKVIERMTTGVLGTSVLKGPPMPVGVVLILSTTSMPEVTLPKTV